MILSFDDYTALGGSLTEKDTFTKLETLTEDLLEAYIREQVPYWKVGSLEEYGLDLKKIITRQIDYLDAHGGVDCFNGNSDLNFTGASTSGFSYSVDSTKTERFHDIPLSSLAKSELDYQLLNAGLSCRAVW